MDTFKDRLQYVIDVKNYSQRQVAHGIDVDEARVSKWISGTVRKPHRKTVGKLADFFDCNFNWLVDGTGDPFPPPKIETAEKTKDFQAHKQVQTESDAAAYFRREKFKKQCGLAYFDEFFDFIAENYGEDQEGVSNFFDELSTTHTNYRLWKEEKKLERESHKSGLSEANGNNSK